MAARLEWFPRHEIDRRILRAALAASFAGAVVKIAATFKEITVAGVFGRTDAMEAFLAAALIPGLLINLIAESMNQALIPTLVRVRETEGHERSQELLSNAMLWSCLLLTGASSLMALGAPLYFPLIASHFGPEKLHLAEKLKSNGRERWQKEFERELGVFADEAFLRGLQSKKRTGA